MKYGGGGGGGGSFDGSTGATVVSCEGGDDADEGVGNGLLVLVMMGTNVFVNVRIMVVVEGIVVVDSSCDGGSSVVVGS